MTKQSTRTIKIPRPFSDEEVEVLGKDPESRVLSSAYDAIASKFPNYVKSGRIELKRSIADSALVEFLDFARSVGARIPKDRSQNHGQLSIFDLVYPSSKEIDSSVFVTSQLLSSQYMSLNGGPETKGLGVFCEIDADLEKDADREFGSVPNLGHLIAVRGKTRQKILNAGLRGLKLIEIPTNTPDGKWPDDIEPLSVIWSDEKLPPVQNHLFDNKKNIFSSEEIDFDNIKTQLYLIDGYRMNGRLFYTGLPEESFDVAITHEILGGVKPCYHQPLYSKKAIKVLREQGMDLECLPVISTTQSTCT
ncbi:MAG: hypothetical protein ACPGN3_05260 [Opitutales bacterium]